jgi:RNA recognition motif-containing protein
MTMNLFVDGLPTSFSSKDLSDLFIGFGTVLKAEVMKNKEGNSLQFGFVAMGTSREAYRAMASLNGSIVSDHLLLVMLAENQSTACCSPYSTQDKPSSFA